MTKVICPVCKNTKAKVFCDTHYYVSCEKCGWNCHSMILNDTMLTARVYANNVKKILKEERQ